jgi:glycosyltransferase involved in cell wall biosynthesis
VVSLSQDNYTTSVGGVQLCIKLEEEAARASARHYLNLHPARAMPFLSHATEPTDIEFGVVFNGTFVGNVAADRIIAVLRSARRSGASADMVVHSLLGHSTEVLVSLHSALAPTRSLFWLHDYFSVCPSFTLLRNDISYCGAPPSQSPACSICVFGEERETHIERLRAACSRIPFEVVSPSVFTRDLWLKTADFPHKSIRVHAHSSIEWSNEPEPRTSDAPVRIAFVGHPANHKGWQTFLHLIEELGTDERYEFHHFGSGLRQHAKAKFTRVSVIEDGAAAMRDALAALDIDAVLIWSIWPETFSFVAHEALSAGAMLLTNEQSGNVATLARGGANGAVYADDQALLSALRGLDLHEQLVRRRKEISRGVPVFGKISMDLLEDHLETSTGRFIVLRASR